MGFEYKIIAKCTAHQVSKIKTLLESNKDFKKKYEFNKNVYWDFRQCDNKGKMPNISICFENDGIYVCRYSGGYLWGNLENIKEYIDHENINYDILDYQE